MSKFTISSFKGYKCPVFQPMKKEYGSTPKFLSEPACFFAA